MSRRTIGIVIVVIIILVVMTYIAGNIASLSGGIVTPR